MEVKEISDSNVDSRGRDEVQNLDDKGTVGDHKASKFGTFQLCLESTCVCNLCRSKDFLA